MEATPFLSIARHLTARLCLVSAGDTLATIVTMVSDYSGKSSSNRNFLVDARTLSISEYAPSKLMNPKYSGRRMVLSVLDSSMPGKPVFKLEQPGEPHYETGDRLEQCHWSI